MVETERPSCPGCGYHPEAGHGPDCQKNKTPETIEDDTEPSPDEQEQPNEFSEVAEHFQGMNPGDHKRITLQDGREVLLVMESKLAAVVDQSTDQKTVKRFNLGSGTFYDEKPFTTRDEQKWAELKRKRR